MNPEQPKRTIDERLDAITQTLEAINRKLEHIKELRGAGLAVDKIADALNTEGIKPRAGVRWHATSVRHVLLAQNAM